MHIAGSCHCRNITFDLDWSPAPAEIPARACSCSFCVKHGGVWTSCPTGTLVVGVADRARTHVYAFGTRTAEFHVCTGCGAVPFVTSRIDGRLFAVVNVNAFDGVDPALLRRAPAVFDGEDMAARLARRQRNWIPDVEIRDAAAAGVNPELDNIIWNSLTGAHRPFSEGTDGARRFVAGFSPIVAFGDLERPDLGGLAPYCEPDAHFYCDGWAGPATDGWRIDEESTMYKMVWTAPPPAVDDAPDAQALGPAHAAQIMPLIAATQPGPFGPRNLELGEYFGWFDDGRLVAMAGERFRAAPFREISAVCTEAGYQGRGLARRLMTKLVRRQLQRGETPFLHVMRANTGALALYRRMGFEIARETVVRVISRA